MAAAGMRLLKKAAVVELAEVVRQLWRGEEAVDCAGRAEPGGLFCKAEDAGQGREEREEGGGRAEGGDEGSGGGVDGVGVVGEGVGEGGDEGRGVEEWLVVAARGGLLQDLSGGALRAAVRCAKE
jgi:hypothetical protein